MTPAMSNPPTEIPAILAKITARAEGGISMARPPDPRMGPTDIETLYPLFLISGRRTVPNIAVLAMVEPLVAAKIVPLTAAKTPSLPGTRPSQRSMISSAMSATWEWYISSPIKMNKGTGVTVKMDRELKIPRVMFFNPADPIKTKMPKKSIRRKAKATGNLVRSKTINPPRKKVSTIYHSMLMPAFF